ncbi:hypothetical protein [Sphingomonas sp. DT-204]|uniref:hypothetical protein n=1 Tax=Sphingomonas sp. DT-204 TaxID=3396166 RepID=UPI003F1B79C2
MLAGLIFATEDAEDQPGTLAATLPFGGSTLIEYQARLLAAVGVRHLVVVVSRVTPALLGATNRIGGKGLAVDVVRSAEDAAAKAHPLSQLIVFADGLVTTDAVVEWVASESHEALLVAQDGDGTPGIERVDSSHSWAGLARIPAARLADVAAMPADYDFQSTLLRLSAQAGAAQLLLPPGIGRTRHGVERNAAAMIRRSKSVLAALGDRRTAWVDRFIFTPVTGWTLPQLVARGVPGWALLAAGGALTLGGLALLQKQIAWPGLASIAVATAAFSTGSMLSWLRGEDRRARFQERAIAAAAALGIVMLGLSAWRETGDGTAIALAVTLIGLAALTERVPAERRRWWGTPGAYPLLLLPFAIVGYPTIGLAIAAIYAFASLAGAIEGSRQKA